MKTLRLTFPLALLGLLIAAKDLSAASGPTPTPAPGTKKIVFVAGRRSHGYGSHEHNAGCLLLAHALKDFPGVQTVVHQNGWPKEANAFEGADAVIIFSDGGGGHVAVPHLDQLDGLAKKGVGIGCIHYAVEVPKGKPGDRFLDWIGGYFAV